MTESQTLYRKYRPRKFEEVIGQTAVIKSLKAIVERESSQAFLFCGPPGTGKTTLARIVARKMGCPTKHIMEIEAATHTGVDEMRAVRDTLNYRPLGEHLKKAIILDECHRLSKNAWDALLKPIEEPPAHVLWLLCTTEPGKIPTTIKTRCIPLNLKPVADDKLEELINMVIDQENVKIPSEVITVVIKEANGSPRQALVNLEMCWDATSRKEATQVLQSAYQSDATIALCRFLLDGGSWTKAMGLIQALSNENPESVRIVICNYMAAVLKNAKTDKAATRTLSILDHFSTPYNASEQQAPLILSIGRVLFAE